MRSDRGFTLIEGLFSFLLMLLVLGSLANTLVNAGKVRANRANMDRAADELHALNAIGADINAALLVLAPGAGEVSPTVRLRRVDPKLSFAQRIDVTRGPELPFENDEQVEVLYEVRDGMLSKLTAASGSTASRSLPMLSAKRLEASREGALVTLTIVFEYSRVEKARVLKVDLR